MRRFAYPIIFICMLSSALTACDFVDQKTLETYTITQPAELPRYTDGHYIAMAYEIYLANGISQSTTGAFLKMEWKSDSLPKPFGLGLLTPLLRFAVTEQLGDGQKKAVQYLSQDSTGSLTLHAFEGIGATEDAKKQNSLWVHSLNVLNTPTEPVPEQVFWSPIDDGAGNTTVGIERSVAHEVVGPCTSTTCPSAATFAFSTYSFVAPAITRVTTPLGIFEAYRLYYQGSLTISSNLPTGPYLDFRTSCWPTGQQGTVTFQGSLWIHPKIGPVQVENTCYFNNNNRTYYFAKITQTSLPY